MGDLELAAFTRLVKRLVKDKASPDAVPGALDRVEVTGPALAEGLGREQLAYINGLRRLREMKLNPDLEREAATDLGRSYVRRFGEAELERLRQLIYGSDSTGGDVTVINGQSSLPAQVHIGGNDIPAEASQSSQVVDESPPTIRESERRDDVRSDY